MEKANANGGLRVTHHPVLGQIPDGRTIHAFIDGNQFEGYAGDTIASALYASGIWILRRSERYGEPRGLYCGIGHCYECRMVVNGQRGVRACLTPLEEGMRIDFEPGPESR